MIYSINCFSPTSFLHKHAHYIHPPSESPTVAPSDSVVRRSISQQKSGVSITIDDPIRTTRQPSPSRGKLSNIVHVTNLVGLESELQLSGCVRPRYTRLCGNEELVFARGPV